MQIAIFSKHTLAAEAMGSLLGRFGHFDVVGHTNDVLRCLTFVRDRGADVVLADAELLTDEVRAYLAGARLVQGFALVLLGSASGILEEDEMLKTPVVSYDSSSEELFTLLRSLKSDTDTTRRPRIRHQSAFGLSAREREVVDLVAKGLSNRQIAEITNLRDQSVKNMVSTVMRRLNCENRTQLALKLTQLAVSRTE